LLLDLGYYFFVIYLNVELPLEMSDLNVIRVTPDECEIWSEKFPAGVKPFQFKDVFFSHCYLLL
jgi:hypothetical protein